MRLVHKNPYRNSEPDTDSDRVVPARVNSRESHVVCGTPNCGTRLASIERSGASHVRLFVKSGIRAGWNSRHYLAHVEKGSPQASPAAKPCLEKIFRFGPATKLLNTILDSRERELPTAVVCYACEHVNLISNQVVGAHGFVNIAPERMT